jgi:hypothetical protein
MRALSWIVFFAAIAVAIYAIRLMRKRLAERRKASEERAASLLAQVAPPSAAPTPAPQRRIDPHERLLVEAAAKAAEAEEAALAIQLYGRLLARFPETGFAHQARAAVEEQRKRLAKA